MNKSKDFRDAEVDAAVDCVGFEARGVDTTMKRKCRRKF